MGTRTNQTELDDEKRSLLEEVTADIEIAKRHGHLDAGSIAALEKTAADLKAELSGAVSRHYTHRVMRNGNECSRHVSEVHALKAARRLQAMSNGRLPLGTFQVELIPSAFSTDWCSPSRA